MTQMTPATLAVVRREWVDGRSPAARLCACAAAEAVAAGILVLGTPLPPMTEGLAAAVLHGTAALLLPGLEQDQPARRWLGAGAVLAVPFFGVAVAAAILGTRGQALIAAPRRRRVRRPALAIAARPSPGAMLSPCDALDSGDEEQRRAALAALARREDPEAIALLRRTAAGRDPDLALAAALALDEMGERAERRMTRADFPGVRHVAS